MLTESLDICKMKFLHLIVYLILLTITYAYRKQNKPALHKIRPIVGGSDANIINFPFQVSFQCYKKVSGSENDKNYFPCYLEVPDLDNDEFEFRHWCGGTIISVEWVLIAAHCAIIIQVVEELDAETSNFWIRAGTSVYSGGGSLHQISQYIVHPKYRGEVNNHNLDVALFRVKPLFEFSPAVQSITLNSHPIETGGIATVIGWGRTSMKGDVPLVLQKVQVPILPQWECKQFYGKLNIIITDNMFCAGRAGRSACHGDSGGPVLYNGVQIGISSFTGSCQRPDYPVVYVNVYNVRDWIHENSGV